MDVPKKIGTKSNDSSFIDLVASSLIEHFKLVQPFYIIDLDVLVRQYHRWVELLPQVKPFYAVKSNCDPMILKTLANLGAGFDCATPNEVDRVASVITG